ncbi:MAG: hypothetical protein RIA65_18520, partial [Woeseia sp.]
MFLLTPVLLPILAVAETPSHALTISADTPVVKVAAREPGRGFLALPKLDYSFSLQPACADNWVAGGLSLSIADSRLNIDPASLGQSLSSLDAQLSVPANQLAPLPLSGFCEATALPEESEVGSETGRSITAADQRLTVTGALSAHAALLCVSEE